MIYEMYPIVFQRIRKSKKIGLYFQKIGMVFVVITLCLHVGVSDNKEKMF